MGSWLVKYSPKIRAFFQTYGRNVSLATARLFYFIFLALRRRWVLIINISHTCSPAVGRELSAFVFSRKKRKRSHRSEIKEMKPAAIQSETFAENPSEEECSWKWRKSGKTTVMLLWPPPGCRSSPSPQPDNQECVENPRFLERRELWNIHLGMEPETGLPWPPSQFRKRLF